MKTTLIKPKEVVRTWWLIDAKDKTLGRIAVVIAKLLMGKHKPDYTPYADSGDYVVVINADKIRVSGEKEIEKIYYHASGYPGGLKETRFRDMIKKHPDFPIRSAVKGMLPKNKLRYRMLKRLKVYAGSEHPHNSQNPVPYKEEK
ncbi:MAG: 50S ribosomal protein L13 [Caldiserica bacterium]|uniref:Large ribosomal subunit protein uL13 n=1 Tax=Aerophobetes bacterium TaxID=2030807 RepID=A0A7V0N0T1_UNCAE|nr:MAG: 50S ribosomal protein L13 [Caldisericota bacterium]RLD15613.1 MAG: 50S ribosomal protein L13 [Caldisericota bacterium]HDN84802.1 50S ribosomal protein L13 [Candidatus Aerophobetes bacterium]